MADNERKVAIVTGSATGVGAAAAIMLAEKGCNVVINYTRSKDDAEETAEQCRATALKQLHFRPTSPKTISAAAWPRQPWTSGVASTT